MLKSFIYTQLMHTINLMKDAEAVVCQIGDFQPFNTANIVRVTAKVRQLIENNLYENSIPVKQAD